MKTVKIQFVDMPMEFDVNDNFILTMLRKHYEVELTENPDFLFYSFGGLEFLKKQDCVRIYVGGEPIIPNFNDCDYAFGYVTNLSFADRYLSIPEFLAGGNGYDICKGIEDRRAVNNQMLNRKFCNFVYSNRKGVGAQLREALCKKLMQYKKVDCPGRVLHNIDNVLAPRYIASKDAKYAPASVDGESNAEGLAVLDDSWHVDKRRFLRQYKFTIAFENVALEGFTSEKLYDPIHACSIPIYWGNPKVTERFNKDAFINCNDYDNDIDKVVRRVIELDQDDEAYMHMLRQNPVTDKLDYHGADRLEEYLVHIIEKGKILVRNQDATDAWPHISLNAAYIWRQNGWDPLVEQHIVTPPASYQKERTVGGLISAELTRKQRLKEAWKIGFPNSFLLAKKIYNKLR